ncbi:hypothetical protein [Streptomyces narbonensis]|uniref:hypothetical protein n=1 Tax=Streptomyces narbonensis TaxID=67333 RepID=UPI0034029A20
MTQNSPTEYERVQALYEVRTDDDNFDDLVAQTARVAREDYVTSKDDHQAAMELLWNHLDGRGVLMEKYKQNQHVRDDSDLGVFVKVFETVNGLA